MNINIHMTQDFLLVLPLFIIWSVYHSVECSVRSQTVLLKACGFDLIATDLNDPC